MFTLYLVPPVYRHAEARRRMFKLHLVSPVFLHAAISDQPNCCPIGTPEPSDKSQKVSQCMQLGRETSCHWNMLLKDIGLEVAALFQLQSLVQESP